MRIGLDIDGVLADFITPFLRLLESRVGGGTIDPASITDPNFQHHPFLTEEIIYQCMVDASYDQDFWRAAAVAQVPMGRTGTPEEIASAVLFLAADENKYLTGQTIHVNGAWLNW